MAHVKASIVFSKRWFFWPAALVICALGKVGILKDVERSAKWPAAHAMRLEVR